MFQSDAKDSAILLAALMLVDLEMQDHHEINAFCTFYRFAATHGDTVGQYYALDAIVETLIRHIPLDVESRCDRDAVRWWVNQKIEQHKAKRANEVAMENLDASRDPFEHISHDNINKQILVHMKAQGMDLAKLSERSNVSRLALDLVLEEGKYGTFDLPQIRRIAEALNVTVYDLLNGSDDAND